MRKKRKKSLRFRFCALFLGIAAALCGCNASVESLLSPPRLSEEQSAIYEALRSGKGHDIHLKYPRSGQYRSAFVVKNIDDEETDEAIVFYEASNVADGGSSLRLNFLDMEDGRWVSVYDFTALGSEVERVNIADLGDGLPCIIITYTIQNTSDTAVSILKYRDGVPTEIYTGRCAYSQITDVDEDGNSEVFLISRDFDSGTATASLLGWGEAGVFQVLSYAPLSSFAECRAVTFGICDEDGNRALFIDRSLADGSIGTDVLVCYGVRLSAAEGPLAIKRRTNSYTPDIVSRDADGDGIIEMAVTTAFPGYENLTRPEQVNLTSWYQLSEHGYSVKRDALSYVSVRGDYLLFIPPRWEGRVTVNVSISEGRATFSEYDSGTHTAGAELLMIRALPTSEEAPENFVLFGESEATGYSFYIRNNSRHSLALTDAELSDCFKILS